MRRYGCLAHADAASLGNIAMSISESCHETTFPQIVADLRRRRVDEALHAVGAEARIVEQRPHVVEAEDEPLVQRRVIEDRMILPKILQIREWVVQFPRVVEKECLVLTLVNWHALASSRTLCEPHGPTCHTGSPSCFFQTLDGWPAGETDGEAAFDLFETIRQRVGKNLRELDLELYGSRN